MVGPLLEVDAVEAVYSRVILALRGVSLLVRRSEIVAVLGANGAGKSTTLKAISNLLPAERGAVTRGRIRFRGLPIEWLPPAELVRLGIVQVLEGRHCFRQLTVEENLRTGAFARRDANRSIASELERVYAYFPRLKEKRGTRAGYTSGGEQQMLAIGRALMANPVLVLLDEPSMGLAPMIVEEIFELIATLNRDEGVSFLLAEQNAAVALRFAHAAAILESGRIVLDGAAADLARREDVKEHYLGIGGNGRISFRERRTTARRRSWLD